MATATDRFASFPEADMPDIPDNATTAASIPGLGEVRTAAVRPVLATATVAVFLASVTQLLLGAMSYAAGSAAVGTVTLVVFLATRTKPTLPDLAAYVVLAAWFIAGTVFVLYFGGLRGPAASALLIVVVFAGILAGRNAMLAVALAGTAVYVLAYLLEQSGFDAVGTDDGALSEVLVVRLGLLTTLAATTWMYTNVQQRLIAASAEARTERDKTRQFYEAMLDASPVIQTVIHAPTGRRTYTSPEFERQFGFGASALDAMTDEQRFGLLHPDDRAVGVDLLESFIDQNGPGEQNGPSDPNKVDGSSDWTFVARYRTDRGWRWLQTELSVLSRDSDGALANILLSRVDIHEQIEFDAERQTLLDSSPTAISAYDAATGAVELSNHAFDELTGIDPSDTGDIRELISTADREAFDEATGNTLEDGVMREIRHRYRHRSGNERWCRTRIAQLPGQDSTARKLLVNSVDITDEVRSDAILDSTEALVMIFDSSTGKASYMNRQYYETTGVTREEFNSWPIEKFSEHISMDDVLALQKARHQARTEGRSDDVVYRFRREDGEHRWLRVRFHQVPAGTGPETQLVLFGLDVTRRLDEEQLRTAILDASPTGFVIVDLRKTTLRYANPAFLELLDTPSDELTATVARDSFLHYIEPDDHRIANAALAAAVKAGVGSAEAVGVRRPNGEVRRVDIRFTRLPSPDGTPSSNMLASAVDVTELLEAQEMQDTVLESSPSVFAIRNVVEGRTEYVNQAYVRITGRDLSSLNDTPSGEPAVPIHPDDEEALIATTQDAVKAGAAGPVNFRLRASDGTWRWMETQITRLAGSGPGAHGRVLVSATDITERIEAEAFADTILRSTPALTVALDVTTGQTLYASPTFEATTGHTLESLNAMTPEEMYALTPAEERPAVDAAITETLHTGEVTAAERSYRSADGTPRWYDSRFLRLGDPSDQRVLITGIDISERKAVEASLEEERVRLERANRNLAEFVHIASHDLQEPLRSLESFAKVLDEELEPEALSDDGRMALELIVGGSDRMTSLVRGLAAYSRIGADREVGPVDVGAVVDDIIADLSDLISREDATVSVGQLPVVLGDATELRLILQNLITNAIKFRQPDSPPEVSIRGSRGGPGWRFEVSDNGIGIAPAQQDRIFQLFQRLHRSDQYPGTGIGLAHCKRAVENHGGVIGVDAEPGRGSTFWFTLSNSGA